MSKSPAKSSHPGKVPPSKAKKSSGGGCCGNPAKTVQSSKTAKSKKEIKSGSGGQRPPSSTQKHSDKKQSSTRPRAQTEPSMTKPKQSSRKDEAERQKVKSQPRSERYQTGQQIEKEHTSRSAPREKYSAIKSSNREDLYSDDNKRSSANQRSASVPPKLSHDSPYLRLIQTLASPAPTSLCIKSTKIQKEKPPAQSSSSVAGGRSTQTCNKLRKSPKILSTSSRGRESASPHRRTYKPWSTPAESADDEYESESEAESDNNPKQNFLARKKSKSDSSLPPRHPNNRQKLPGVNNSRGGRSRGTAPIRNKSRRPASDQKFFSKNKYYTSPDAREYDPEFQNQTTPKELRNRYRPRAYSYPSEQSNAGNEVIGKEGAQGNNLKSKLQQYLQFGDQVRDELRNSGLQNVNISSQGIARTTYIQANQYQITAIEIERAANSGDPGVSARYSPSDASNDPDLRQRAKSYSRNRQTDNQPIDSYVDTKRRSDARNKPNRKSGSGREQNNYDAAPAYDSDSDNSEPRDNPHFVVPDRIRENPTCCNPCGGSCQNQNYGARNQMSSSGSGTDQERYFDNDYKMNLSRNSEPTPNANFVIPRSIRQNQPDSNYYPNENRRRKSTPGRGGQKRCCSCPAQTQQDNNYYPFQEQQKPQVQAQQSYPRQQQPQPRNPQASQKPRKQQPYRTSTPQNVPGKQNYDTFGQQNQPGQPCDSCGQPPFSPIQFQNQTHPNYNYDQVPCQKASEFYRDETVDIKTTITTTPAPSCSTPCCCPKNPNFNNTYCKQPSMQNYNYFPRPPSSAFSEGSESFQSFSPSPLARDWQALAQQNPTVQNFDNRDNFQEYRDSNNQQRGNVFFPTDGSSTANTGYTSTRGRNIQDALDSAIDRTGKMQQMLRSPEFTNLNSPVFQPNPPPQATTSDIYNQPLQPASALSQNPNYCNSSLSPPPSIRPIDPNITPGILLNPLQQTTQTGAAAPANQVQPTTTSPAQTNSPSKDQDQQHQQTEEAPPLPKQYEPIWKSGGTSLPSRKYGQAKAYQVTKMVYDSNGAVALAYEQKAELGGMRATVETLARYENFKKRLGDGFFLPNDQGPGEEGGSVYKEISYVEEAECDLNI